MAVTTEFSNRLSTPGVWFFTDQMAAAAAAEFASEVESLGYSTLWLPETIGRDPFAHIAWLGSQTTSLTLATGIANIFHRHPGPMKQVANTIGEQTGGRFILGLGVSHGPMVAGVRGLDYSKPLSQMRDYLTAMESQPFRGQQPSEAVPVVLAALGPKMLELAGSAADGAHPYWTTADHTALARDILGPDALLCVEQKICLSTDAAAAREAARAAISIYADLPNYRNNWKRLGFTEDEIEHRDNRFIDAVVVWGDEDRVRQGIADHYDAGATHVCIQPLSIEGPTVLDRHALEVLAPN